MRKFLKKNGTEQEFDPKKIFKGIVKAMRSGSGVYHKNLAEMITEETDTKFGKKEVVSSDEVDKFVLNRLIEYGQSLTAHAYERFKTIKSYQKTDEIIDNDIYGIVDGTNTAVKSENANKDSRRASTQRDLIAGVVSRSYSERKIMPPHLLAAHNEGLIHIHDTDYMINHIHNCFTRDTFFITDKGVKSFLDFNDGDEVIVPTHLGNWKKGIVRCYGEDNIYEYRLSMTDREGCGVSVKCTKNHRWFDNTGNEQIGLSIGDKLLTKNHLINSFDFETATIELKKMWVYGFVLGDGCTKLLKFKYGGKLGKRPIGSGSKGWITHVRLCGGKSKYESNFIAAGYKVTHPDCFNNEPYINIIDFNKHEFLDNRLFNSLSKDEAIAMFNGLLAADGEHSKNGNASSISSSNPIICEFIEKYADVAGFFITSIFQRDNETNYVKRTNPLTTYYFTTYLPTIYTKQNGMVITKPRTIKVISEKAIGKEEVWCLEVEDDHSFTLQGGIITGNCQLIDMKNMLQNGTVINGKLIRKPKSFQTACTVATQISLSVSSGQYGGQTFSTAHLAPFVRISYEKYLNQFLEEGLSQEKAEELADKFTRQEVKAGAQTIQFQENTFSSTNGQTPFVSIFMYINEEPEFIKENVLIIEEMLKLRYEGMENEFGVKVTPAFPKLLYVLDENNIHKDSEYRWLTDLAIKCSAKRMNPDYISAKVMRDLYEGNVFPCMGCVDGISKIKIRYKDSIIEDSFEKIYELLKLNFKEESQSEGNINKIIHLENVEIFDSQLKDFTICKSIIRNIQDDWRIVILSNNTILKCTSNHPWTLVNKDNVEARDLKISDKVYTEDGKIEEIVKIILCKEVNYSYDVTTESEHFTVNGIYTHNCRSFLSPWKEPINIEPITSDEEFELE